MSARLWRRAALASVRRHPAPALLLASAAGWAAMLWFTLSGHGTHAAHTAHAASLTTGTGPSTHGFEIWASMVAAMAPLLLLREGGRLWRGSLRRRRLSTLTIFLGAYALPWMALGTVAVPLAHAVSGSVGLIWAAVALAALWQCSPARQRRLNLCHRTPALRVFGAAGRWDAGRYGVITGGACVASCGPLMLLVLLAADYHVVAMAVVTIAAMVERYLPARRPEWRLPFVPASSPEWLGVR